MCKAVNIKFEEYDVYGGRPGKGIIDAPFGNPHPVGKLCPLCNVIHKRGEAVKEFRKWFYSDDGKWMRDLVKARIKKGDRLGCFCKPFKECHCDTIAEFVNNDYEQPYQGVQEERNVWE